MSAVPEDAPARTWPPKKGDLERLYLVEKLSAAKIARVYGLRYKNPKVAESTILYQLKKNGIKRRDPAEHVRKVTDEMVGRWVERYEAGESLKRIAGSSVSPVTVFLHLRKRGVKLRDKVEAQIRAVTKYRRTPFRGDAIERAYLMGLRYGDLDAVRHGRAIRVRVSTTHPAMSDLFESLFSSHGYVHRYARESKLTPGYEWTLEVDLDATFEFLLDKPPISELEPLNDKEFLGFLAGIFDSEGTVHLHKKKKWYGPEVWITNSDSGLINTIATRLKVLGYHTYVSWVQQKLDRGGISGRSLIGRVYVLRFSEVRQLLSSLPSRHREKLLRTDLLMRVSSVSRSADLREMVHDWKEVSNEIRREVRAFVESARAAVASGHPENYLSGPDSSEKLGISPDFRLESESSSNGRTPQANNSAPSR